MGLPDALARSLAHHEVDPALLFIRLTLAREALFELALSSSPPGPLLLAWLGDPLPLTPQHPDPDAALLHLLRQEACLKQVERSRRFPDSFQGLHAALAWAERQHTLAGSSPGRTTPVGVLIGGVSLTTRAPEWQTPIGRRHRKQELIPGDGVVWCLLEFSTSPGPLGRLTHLARASDPPHASLDGRLLGQHPPEPTCFPVEVRYQQAIQILHAQHALTDPGRRAQVLRALDAHWDADRADRADRADHGAAHGFAQLRTLVHTLLESHKAPEQLALLYTNASGFQPTQASLALSLCLAGLTDVPRYAFHANLGSLGGGLDLLRSLALAATAQKQGLWAAGPALLSHVCPGLSKEQAFEAGSPFLERPAQACTLLLEDVPVDAPQAPTLEPLFHQRACRLELDATHPGQIFRLGKLRQETLGHASMALTSLGLAEDLLFQFLADPFCPPETLTAQWDRLRRNTRAYVEETDTLPFAHPLALTCLLEGPGFGSLLLRCGAAGQVMTEAEATRLEAMTGPLLALPEEVWTPSLCEALARSANPWFERLYMRLVGHHGWNVEPTRVREWLSHPNLGLRIEGMHMLSRLLRGEGSALSRAQGRRWEQAMPELIGPVRAELDALLRHIPLPTSKEGLPRPGSDGLRVLATQLRTRGHETLRWAQEVSAQGQPPSALPLWILTLCEPGRSMTRHSLIRCLERGREVEAAWLCLAVLGRPDWMHMALRSGAQRLVSARPASAQSASARPVDSSSPNTLPALQQLTSEEACLLIPPQVAALVSCVLLGELPTDKDEEAKSESERCIQGVLALVEARGELAYERWRLGGPWSKARLVASLGLVSEALRGLFNLELIGATWDDAGWVWGLPLEQVGRVQESWWQVLVSSWGTAMERWQQKQVLKGVPGWELKTLEQREDGKEPMPFYLCGRRVAGTMTPGEVSGVGAYVTAQGAPVMLPTRGVLKQAKGLGRAVYFGDGRFLTGRSRMPTRGDELPGVVGALNGRVGGEVRAMLSAPRLLVEGEGVLSHGDVLLMDGGNHPGVVRLSEGIVPPTSGLIGSEEELCEYCGKPVHRFPQGGDTAGDATKLRDVVLNGLPLVGHRFFAGRKSLQAHHVLMVQSVNKITHIMKGFVRFGIDINARWNGVLLPRLMAAACALHVPLHRGNHQKGWAYDENVPILKAVEKRLKLVGEDIKAGVYCEHPNKLQQKLEDIVKEIVSKLASFTWTLTRDGQDYAPGGIGCGGGTSVSQPKQPCCPSDRHHTIDNIYVMKRFRGILKPGE